MGSRPCWMEGRRGTSSRRQALAAFLLAACLVAPAGADTLPLAAGLRPIYDGTPPRTVAQIQAMDVHQQRLAEFLRRRTVGVMVAGSQGSGVIISPDGYVLTAAHVCVKANQRCVVILPDGRRVWGKTLGLNRIRDAGLVKIDNPVKYLDNGLRTRRKKPVVPAPEGERAKEETPAGGSAEPTWPYVEMAPAESLHQGMWCVATGHPGGYERNRQPVVRVGRVLFVSKAIVRTDCVLVGGDSGGPLCDMQGRVIGIHSRIGGRLNMNLHVPINVYRDSWERLVRGDDWGRTPPSASASARPMIGVREDRDASEARIGEVIPGMPADRAGIRAGDVIVKFNGKPVPDFDTLVQRVQETTVGQRVVVEIRRGEQILQLKLTVGAAQPER